MSVKIVDSVAKTSTDAKEFWKASPDCVHTTDKDGKYILASDKQGTETEIKKGNIELRRIKQNER